METLKINIPTGYVVDTFDKSTGEITLKEKPKDVKERIKTMDDVLKELDIDPDDFEEICEELEHDEIAYRKLKLLVRALNEGWEPDWSNNGQYKYFAWFEMGGSSGFRFLGYDYWISNSIVGSRLCFKSRELAEHAGKQFTEVYKDFMTI